MIRRLTLPALAAVALAACDLGPNGPGTLGGTVTAPDALGAVVLELVGASVVGFESRGSTLAFDVTLPDQRHLPPYVRKYRVMLVGQTGGDLQFGVHVRDLDHDFPAVVVVDAADASNAPTTAGEVRVHLVRP